MSTRMSRGLAALAVAGAAFGGLATAGAQAATASSAPSGASTAAVAKLGTGWSAAIHHEWSLNDDQGTLVVVSPTGASTTIGEVSDDAGLYDVSADGRKVVTARFQDGQARITVWDVATKKPTYFRVTVEPTNGSFLLQFGGPGLIVMAESGLQTYTLGGAHVGSLGLDRREYTVSRDGSMIFSTAVSGSLDVGINAFDAWSGDVVQVWGVPDAYQVNDASCTVNQEWTAGVPALDCAKLNSDSTIGAQSFRLNADLSATALTPTRSAWALNTTQRRAAWRPDPGPGANACNQFGVLSGASLKAVPTMPIGQCAADYTVSGASGRTANVVQLSYYDGDVSEGSLKAYDTVTNKVRVLAGTGSASGGIITSAQTVDGHH